VTLYEELLQRKKSTNELVLNAASFFRSEFPKNLASSLKCHQNKINYNIGSPTISDFEVKFSITAHVRVTDSNAIDFILNLPSFPYILGRTMMVIMHKFFLMELTIGWKMKCFFKILC